MSGPAEEPDENDLHDDHVVVPRLSWSGPELAAWVRWIGVGRVLAAGGMLLVGVAVAWWLLRPPVLPTEAVLPQATTTAPAAGDEPAPSTALQPGTARTGTLQTGTPATSAPSAVLVHAAGAVVRPGVVAVPVGARVVDVIDAAGGARADGAIDALNLAAPVHDGDRVEVPVIGAETVGPLHRTGGSQVAETGPIDLNTADAALLQTLPGIGGATADAIIEHRVRNGPFANVDELDDVSGIGPAKLARLRELVTV